MSVMQRYHALVRAIVRDDPKRPSARAASRGASAKVLHYRTLVRLQHRQSLLSMFGPVAEALGAARFERVVDDLRRRSPPSDPNPSRWAAAFAQHLSERADVSEHVKAVAELLAARVAVNLAPDDDGAGDGVRAGAELRVFSCDPRRALAGAAGAAGAARRTVLAIHRDREDRVQVSELDRDAVAAWGVASGDAEPAELARAGIDDDALARGRERLVDLGLLSRGSVPRQDDH